jgi:outer membrane protein
LRRDQIRQALADLRKAQNALALQEKKILLDSKISFLDYKTAKSTLLNLHDELKSARENFNAVQMQFKYGMADSIDMMDANTLLVTAQRRISDARYTYYLSVLKILYTRGDLISFLLKQA